MRPIVEKKKFHFVYVIYAIIIIVCVVAIGIAVYNQFFKDEKLGIILGITKEEDEEEINNLKENFMNIFDNSIVTLNGYSGNINKVLGNQDTVFTAYDIQEENDYYSLDLKIPFININTKEAKNVDMEIKNTFKNKSENIINSTESNNNKIVYNVRYKAYLYDEILSLVILSELKEGESNQRIIVETFNYNLNENRLCTIDEILEKKQISKDVANEKIESEIDKSQEKNVKLKELGYNVNVRDSKSDEYDIDNASVFFIGENEYLYIVYAYGNTSFTSEMDEVIIK